MFIGATKKVYRHEKLFLQLRSFIHWSACPSAKSPKTLATQSELRRLGGFKLQLQFIRNQGDELTVGGLSLGIGNRIAEKPLQGVQVSSVPGYLDGVPDCPLHPGWGGLEGLGHLRIEHLGDGVRVPGGPRRGFQKWVIWKVFCEGLIALFVARCFLSSSGL